MAKSRNPPRLSGADMERMRQLQERHQVAHILLELAHKPAVFPDAIPAPPRKSLPGHYRKPK